MNACERLDVGHTAITMANMQLSSYRSDEHFLAITVKIFSFIDGQKKFTNNTSKSANEGNKRQISIGCKYDQLQRGSTTIKFEAERRCDLKKMKQFVRDDILSGKMTENQNVNFDGNMEFSFEFFDDASGAYSYISLKNGELQEHGHLDVTSRTLKICLKIMAQDQSIVGLMNNLKVFLKHYYLIDRQDRTALDYEVGDVRGSEVFSNDTAEGFVNVGKCKFVGNATQYATWAGCSHSLKPYKLSLVRSKCTRIPETNYNLTLAYGKFLEDDYTKDRDPLVTILPFSADKIPLFRMPDVEWDFFSRFMEKVNKSAEDVGVSLMSATAGQPMLLFNVTIKPQYAKMTQVEQNSLVLFSIQHVNKNTINVANVDFSCVDMDGSWSENLIKWLMKKLVRHCTKVEKKTCTGNQARLNSVVQGISRSFTDILANTRKKRFKRECLRIVQADSADSFELQVSSLIQDFLTKRHYARDQIRTRPFERTSISDFESLDCQMFPGAINQDSSQLLERPQMSSVPSAAASLSSVATLHRDMGPRNAMRKRKKAMPEIRANNFVAEAGPRKDMNAIIRRSACQFSQQGIKMDDIVKDGTPLPREQTSIPNRVINFFTTEIGGPKRSKTISQVRADSPPKTDRVTVPLDATKGDDGGYCSQHYVCDQLSNSVFNNQTNAQVSVPSGQNPLPDKDQRVPVASNSYQQSFNPAMQSVQDIIKDKEENVIPTSQHLQGIDIATPYLPDILAFNDFLKGGQNEQYESILQSSKDEVSYGEHTTEGMQNLQYVVEEERLDEVMNGRKKMATFRNQANLPFFEEMPSGLCNEDNARKRRLSAGSTISTPVQSLIAPQNGTSLANLTSSPLQVSASSGLRTIDSQSLYSHEPIEDFGYLSTQSHPHDSTKERNKCDRLGLGNNEDYPHNSAEKLSEEMLNFYALFSIPE